MWWSIIVGVIILLALIMVALWGVYGDQLKAEFLEKKQPQQPQRPPAEPEARKEPVFVSPGSASQQSLSLDFTPPQLPDLDEHWQADYCYVVRFFEEQAQLSSHFVTLKDKLRQRNINIYQLLGYHEQVQHWQVADQTPCRYWVILIPLADRNGSMSSQRIKLIENDCRRFAEQQKQRVLFSPLEEALERAALLDKFCNEVDIVLNLRLIFADTLNMAAIDELLVRSYHALDGKHYVYRLDSEILFSAKPVLLPNNEVREIVFSLDAPRVSQPQRAFEDMIQRMQEICELKQGQLFDRQNKQLTQTDISVMRGGIDLLVAEMSEKGVTPGGRLAYLLFS
ncbi:MAG: cell division protein ZipA C-terminal FtsZ-binding domain-containing protein [Proteobacteria bacterium]|nr:cell division protein ZipA C-terminal FtsZ-binding domain-containing protein [Pseudomonadota bacterium]MCH9758697.1 cell division protein ZipA C-terminal FtsZ-binding domain-containing protein [Pseudomonadota bacterium]